MSDLAMRKRLDELAEAVERQGRELNRLSRRVIRPRPTRAELEAYMAKIREKHATKEG
jgi:hypothetical protein